MFMIQPRDRYGVPLRDDFGLLDFTVGASHSRRLASSGSLPHSSWHTSGGNLKPQYQE